MKKRTVIIIVIIILLIITLFYVVRYDKDREFKQNITNIDKELELDVFTPEIDKVLRSNALNKEDLLIDEAKTFNVSGGYELSIPLKTGGKISIFRLDNDPDNIQAVYTPPGFEGDVVIDEEIQEDN